VSDKDAKWLIMRMHAYMQYYHMTELGSLEAYEWVIWELNIHYLWHVKTVPFRES